MDELQWIRDIESGVALKSNTLYHFDPKLNAREMELLYSRVLGSDTRIISWLDVITVNYSTMRYFFTSEAKGGVMSVTRWCTSGDPTKIYDIESCNYINGRELFGIL